MSDYKFLDIPYRRSKIHCKDTYLYDYFYNELFEKVLANFEFTMPKEWDRQYFMEALLGDGVVCVIKTSEFGVIPQRCSLSGFNVYKKPTRVTVSNALIQKYDYKIGEETEIIFLKHDFTGFNDVVSYYADLMALTSESYKINQINTRKTAIVNVDNKAQAETMKKAYDNLASGDSAVFVSYGGATGKPWQFFADTSQYIGGNLLNDLKSIENNFDTELGLNTANTQKKERLITDEVNANNQSTAIKPKYWVECLEDCFEKVKNMFGVELSVKQRLDLGGENNVEHDNGFGNSVKVVR